MKCHWRLGGDYLYLQQWSERPAYAHRAANDSFFLYFSNDAWYISAALGSTDVFAYIKSNALDVRGIAGQWLEYCESAWSDSDLLVSAFTKDSSGFLQCAAPCSYNVLQITVSDHGTGYFHEAPPLVYCDFGEAVYQNATPPNKTWGVCTPPEPQYSIVTVTFNGTNLDWADSDGDGSISEAELSQYFAVYGGAYAATYWQRKDAGPYASIDTDNDQDISVAEFDVFVDLALLPDANGDGNVSEHELLEFEMARFNHSITNMTAITHFEFNGTVIVFAPLLPPIKYRNKTVMTIPPQTCVDEYNITNGDEYNIPNEYNITNSTQTDANASAAGGGGQEQLQPVTPAASANATARRMVLIRHGGNLSSITGLNIVPVIPHGLLLQVTQGRTSVLEPGAHGACLASRVPHGNVVVERGQLAGLEIRQRRGTDWGTSL